MGRKVALDDLNEVHPVIFRSLKKLLDEPNADQLGLVFQVRHHSYCAAVYTCLSCVYQIRHAPVVLLVAHMPMIGRSGQ